MKTNSLKITIPAVALVLVTIASLYIASVHAEPPRKDPNPPLTTDWTGYLAVGTDETIDPMPLRQPDVKAVPGVELGLRSDGIVVWRKVSKAK